MATAVVYDDDIFSAHSGKQQLDERGGRESEPSRALMGEESMSSLGEYAHAHSEIREKE